MLYSGQMAAIRHEDGFNLRSFDRNWDSSCFYWPRSSSDFISFSVSGVQLPQNKRWQSFVCLFPNLRFVWLCRRPRTWANLWPHVSYSVSSLLRLLLPWHRCPPSLSTLPQTLAPLCSRVSPYPGRSCTRPLDPSVQHTHRFYSPPTDPIKAGQIWTTAKSRPETCTRCDIRHGSLYSV